MKFNRNGGEFLKILMNNEVAYADEWWRINNIMPTQFLNYSILHFAFWFLHCKNGHTVQRSDGDLQVVYCLLDFLGNTTTAGIVSKAPYGLLVNGGIEAGGLVDAISGLIDFKQYGCLAPNQYYQTLYFIIFYKVNIQFSTNLILQKTEYCYIIISKF